EAQEGQTALPSGQRIETMKCNARSASAKYLMASNSVLGNSVLSFMSQQSHETSGESSILLPVQALAVRALAAVFLRLRYRARRLRFSILLYCLPINLYFPRMIRLFSVEYEDPPCPVQSLFPFAGRCNGCQLQNDRRTKPGQGH